MKIKKILSYLSILILITLFSGCNLISTQKYFEITTGEYSYERTGFLGLSGDYVCTAKGNIKNTSDKIRTVTITIKAYDNNDITLGEGSQTITLEANEIKYYEIKFNCGAHKPYAAKTTYQ